MHGPNPRRKEFSLLRGVIRDFLRGFRALHFVGPCATVFGSARFDENHRYYKLAREMGAALSKMGFTVMTGGGPGIMEAANRGAKDVGGRSVGCNIKLPFEQSHN
ncbi:MAG: LOG family protein, partial [bacterium]